MTLEQRPSGRHRGAVLQVGAPVGAHRAPSRPALPPLPDPGPARSRLYELDLLRWIAALAVLAYHFAGGDRPMWNGDAREIFPELRPVAHFGYLGVDLFFLISGFVILMSVWDRRPSDFVLGRVARLFPAYWFAVSLALFVHVGTDHSAGQEAAAPIGTLERFLPNMTLLQQGVGVPHMESAYWVLWVELHFYALIALFAWRGVGYRRSLWFMGGWLLLSVFAKEADEPFLKAVLIADWAPWFIAGMAFCLIHRFGSNLVLWLLVGFCYALGCYYRADSVRAPERWPDVHEWAVPLVVTLIFVVMALAALGRLGFVRWRGLAVLGGMSYPLYLVHETVARPIVAELRISLDPWAVLGIAVAASLAIACLVHLLIERPLTGALSAALHRAVRQIRADGADAR